MSVQVVNVAVTGLVAAYAFNETPARRRGRIRKQPHGHGQWAAWNPAAIRRGAQFRRRERSRDCRRRKALSISTTGMTLSAWVRPTTLSGWRTRLLKEAPGGLAYALYAHDDVPQPAVYARIGNAERTTAGLYAAVQYVEPSRRHLRWRHATPVRQWRSGLERGEDWFDGRDSRRAPDRWEQRVGRVLRRGDRRGSHLQPSSFDRRDSGRHDLPAKRRTMRR